MKRRDVKLTPPAYMHLYEKRWLDPNHIKHNIQCTSRDVKFLHTHVPYKEEMSSSSMWDTLNMNLIYREDVKLPLHIGNLSTNILKSLLRQNFEFSWSQQNKFWYQWNHFEVDKTKVIQLVSICSTQIPTVIVLYNLCLGEERDYFHFDKYAC